MPLNLSDWGSIAAIVSAMCDVIATGRDTFQAFYQKRIQAADARERAEILRSALSTYSNEEVEAIRERLASCRQRFIAEGSGQQRKRCLCSVLQDVKDGNGGTIPFPDWEEAYRTLGCAQGGGSVSSGGSGQFTPRHLKLSAPHSFEPPFGFLEPPGHGKDSFGL